MTFDFFEQFGEKVKNLIICFCALSSYVVVLGEATADVTINFTEAGNDVLASADGVIDLFGLGQPFVSSTTALVNPSRSGSVIGPASSTSIDVYSSPSGSSLPFGSGTATSADSGSGDYFGFSANGDLSFLNLPVGYLSGTALTADSIYTGVDFQELGISPGTFVYTIGSNTITLNAGVAIPEPTHASSLSLIFISLLCRRRKR